MSANKYLPTNLKLLWSRGKTENIEITKDLREITHTKHHVTTKICKVYNSIKAYMAHQKAKHTKQNKGN